MVKHPKIKRKVAISVNPSKITDVENPTSNDVRVKRTSVCNVKVGFLRPKYKNLKDWVNDPNNIYIGRAGVVFVDGERFPKLQYVWMNPFKIGKDGDRNKVISKFDDYIRHKIISENLDIATLRNKNLGCWCVSSTCFNVREPVVCHGQVLLKILEENYNYEQNNI